MRRRIPGRCHSVLPFFAMRICSGELNASAILTRLLLQCQFSPSPPGGLGNDQVSRGAIVDARRMAEEMKLLGVAHDSSLAAEFHQMSPEILRAVSHVAWGSYSFMRYAVADHLSVPDAGQIVSLCSTCSNLTSQLTTAA